MTLRQLFSIMPPRIKINVDFSKNNNIPQAVNHAISNNAKQNIVDSKTLGIKSTSTIVSNIDDNITDTAQTKSTEINIRRTTVREKRLWFDKSKSYLKIKIQINIAIRKPHNAVYTDREHTYYDLNDVVTNINSMKVFDADYVTIHHLLEWLSILGYFTFNANKSMNNSLRTYTKAGENAGFYSAKRQLSNSFIYGCTIAAERFIYENLIDMLFLLNLTKIVRTVSINYKSKNNLYIYVSNSQTYIKYLKLHVDDIFAILIDSKTNEVYIEEIEDVDPDTGIIKIIFKNQPYLNKRNEFAELLLTSDTNYAVKVIQYKTRPTF